MEALTRETVAARLIKAGTAPDRARMYADAFVEYREAMANIAANGSIVANPRTGAPMDNPFLRVRDRASAQLVKLRGRVQGLDALWREPV